MLSLDAAKLNLTKSIEVLPKAVPGTIATPAYCMHFFEYSKTIIPVPLTLGIA